MNRSWFPKKKEKVKGKGASRLKRKEKRRHRDLINRHKMRTTQITEK